MIAEYFEKLDWRRVVVMCIGTIFIAMGVAIFKFAALGNCWDDITLVWERLSMHFFKAIL